MTQDFQIIEVGSNGSPVVYHPETNADVVLTGVKYRVPMITDITDWQNKSKEVVAARSGETNLLAKIKKIDDALVPSALLTAIKRVHGTNSGLDSDLVDGCNVDDVTLSEKTIWTSNKVVTELNKKVNNTDVTNTPTASKILRLDKDGRLPASITGNAMTANTLAGKLNLKFGGDLIGETTFNGGEGSVNVNLEIRDNSHEHSYIKVGDKEVSLNDEATNNSSLWSSLKIMEQINLVPDSVTEVEDGEIKIGILRIKYGEVDITNSKVADIVFKTPFNSILFNNHCCETSDVNLVATVEPKSVTNEGFNINLNNIALDGKIIWFAVGM